MRFRQLRYFCKIVECGSFSRAAATIHVAQPALSQQIAELETQVEQYRHQLAALIASAIAQHRSRRKPKAEHIVIARALRRRPAATSKGRPSKAAKTTPKTAHHRTVAPVRHRKH